MHPQQSEHGAYADYEDGDGHGDGGRDGDGDGDGDFEGSQDPDTPSIPARIAFRRFWPMTKGLRGFLLIVWLCTVLNALAETAAILLFSDLTDHALQQGSLDAFWSPAAQWLGVAVARRGRRLSRATRSPHGPPNASSCGCASTSSTTSSNCRRTSSSATARATCCPG